MQTFDAGYPPVDAVTGTYRVPRPLRSVGTVLGYSLEQIPKCLLWISVDLLGLDLCVPRREGPLQHHTDPGIELDSTVVRIAEKPSREQELPPQ